MLQHSDRIITASLPILAKARKGVDAVKWALGISGIAAAAAISVSLFQGKVSVALGAILVMITLMFALYLFARITTAKDPFVNWLARFLALCCVAVFASSCILFFSSTFFAWPIAQINHTLFPQPPKPENRPTVWEEIMSKTLNPDFERLTVVDKGDTESKRNELGKLMDAHGPALEYMLIDENNPTALSPPHKVVSLYLYLAMACYQKAAISQHFALRPDGTGRNSSEALKLARQCIEYADKGLEWETRIKEYQPNQVNESWTLEKYEYSKSELIKRPFRLHLIWYRTAGRAISAYYSDDVGFLRDVREEVKNLSEMEIFQPKDRPEDDETMMWFLTSNEGEKPPTTK